MQNKPYICIKAVSFHLQFAIIFGMTQYAQIKNSKRDAPNFTILKNYGPSPETE